MAWAHGVSPRPGFTGGGRGGKGVTNPPVQTEIVVWLGSLLEIFQEKNESWFFFAARRATSFFRGPLLESIQTG